MTWLDAIILGILQGLTEFLPVSSSGHLVIMQKLMGLEQHDLAFDVVAHLGTFTAVLVVYRQLFWDILKRAIEGLRRQQINPSVRVCLLVAAGSVPTGIIGLTFKDQFESLFSNVAAVGGFLLVTAVLLLLTKFKQYKVEAQSLTNIEEIAGMKWSQALWVGFFQGLAITPGISRAGSTIASGILFGLKGNVAAGFSFMLAVPAVLGAAVLELRHVDELPIEALAPLAVGFVTSFFFGLIGLRLVLRFVSRGRLDVFSYYLMVVGTGTLIYSWLN